MSGQKRPSITVPHFDHIPQEMRERPQWLTWIWEWKDTKQKWDKKPQGGEGGWGSPIKKERWTTFDKARTFILRHPGHYGLGFAFTDGIMGIDLDHILDEDGAVVVSWLAPWIDTLRPTYIEKSPSGTGLHLYGMCEYPFESGHNVGQTVGVEMYGKGRYFTVTGDTDDPCALGRWDPHVIRALYTEAMWHKTGIRAHGKTGAHVGEDGRAHVGEFDGDYSDCVVALSQVVPMFSKGKFHAHWQLRSVIAGGKGDGNSERGQGLATLCRIAGWSIKDTAGMLNLWCDETHQERYHTVKMRMTLETAFRRKGENTQQPPQKREDVQAWITQRMGLRVERIVQRGLGDGASYAVYITGKETPIDFKDTSTFIKREVWNSRAADIALLQGYEATMDVAQKDWPLLLKYLRGLREYEEAPETSIEEETALWISYLVDDRTPTYDSLDVMSSYDLERGAFRLVNGTVYLSAEELQLVLANRHIAPPKGHIYAHLRACFWVPAQVWKHPDGSGKPVLRRYWKKQE